MEKNALIQWLHDARAEWEGILAQVGDPRMTTPGATGHWSVKDMIAHLAAWEQRPVAWLTAIRRAESPEPAAWPPNLSEEKTNEWIFEANKDRLLHDVVDESHQIHARLLKELETVTDDELNDAQRYSWLNGNSLADSIPGDSSEHYQDHAQMVREWLALEKVQ